MLEEITRWTRRRKAALLILIEKGELTVTECLDRYNISKEEFAEWNEMAKKENYYEI